MRTEPAIWNGDARPGRALSLDPVAFGEDGFPATLNSYRGISSKAVHDAAPRPLVGTGRC
jgi:hypothetical protein